MSPFRAFAIRSSFALLLVPLATAGAHAPAPPPRTAPPPASAGVLELRRDLSEILDAPGWDARFGVIVVSLDRGDTLFARDPDLPLAPASNLKLYSTAAALHYLGPSYRFPTLHLADLATPHEVEEVDGGARRHAVEVGEA